MMANTIENGINVARDEETPVRFAAVMNVVICGNSAKVTKVATASEINAPSNVPSAAILLLIRTLLYKRYVFYTPRLESTYIQGYTFPLINIYTTLYI